VRKSAEIAEAFAPREALAGKNSFFLVGIGGAGMSALARMLKHRGFRVRGTDSTRSLETDRLQSEGIEVHIGHSGEYIEPTDAVVLTDAIDLGNNPEVNRAKEVGAPMFRRSQALGWLLRDKKVIAVTGTHGKTTTTGMVGAGLQAAGLDPLIVVGANVPQFGGPVVEGKGKWAVVEACEAYDSFHDIDPAMVVLTNLELDHVDFHGTYESLRDSVVRFVGRMPETGSLIYSSEDPGAVDVMMRSEAGKTPYSADDYRKIAPDAPMPTLPGRHNLSNAVAALKAAEFCGADPSRAAEGIAAFTGAERRLQILLDGQVTVVDDYAHHPSEIDASLKALREKFPGRRLVVAYQPHLYSRTESLISEFAQALDNANLVVLTDIYPAREAPIPGVSSARIAELVTKPVMYVPNRHLLPMKVARALHEGDVVVGMGAGNIAEFAPALIKELGRAARRISTPLPPSSKTSHFEEGGKPSVAVIYGGDSAEREISILSGRAIHGSLLSQGYTSRMVDVTELMLSKGDVSQFIGPDRPDVAILAVHGTHAEDGAIQGLFELLHIPYTGSGIQASAIAMDKQMTKMVLQTLGVRVPTGVHLHSPTDPVGLEAPLIVKPNAQGSTVGLSFVRTNEELRQAIEKAFAYDDSVLVEEWIEGMEISTPVLGDRALLPVEIVPVSGRYDFASKYSAGATEEIVPARLPEHLLAKSQELALKAHNALGCTGATRTDMIVRGEELYVLEVNTLPGMTGTSLLPNSAQAAGIDFDALVIWIIEDALARHATKA
jgi:D-alanine--D-alanine ligase